MSILNKALIEIKFDELVSKYNVKISLNESNYLITEEQGLFPNANIILNLVYKYCVTYINNNQPNEIKDEVYTYIINIPDNIFDTNNLFFDKIDLHIQIHMSQSTFDIDDMLLYNNGYCPTNSKIKNNKLTNFQINIEFGCYNIDNLKSKLAPLLYHEFTHAYEDYNRLLNGATNMNDMVNNPSNVYAKQIRLDSENNQYVTVVSTIFYLSNKTENNAFVGEVYGELDGMMPKIKLNNLSLKDIIHKFPLWDEFVNTEYNLDYLKKINDIGIQIDIISATSYMIGKKLTNYQQTIALLENILFHSKQRLIKKVQRAIENRIYKNSHVMGHPIIKKLIPEDSKTIKN